MQYKPQILHFIMSTSHTIVYWLNAHDQSAFSLLILCIMIKIIEYVQESFCSFRKQETTGHLILSEFPQPYPFYKLSHIKIFGLFTHHKNIKVFSRSRIWDISHESKKPNSLNFQFPSLDQSQVTNDDRMSYIICSRTIRGLVYDFYWSI